MNRLPLTSRILALGFAGAFVGLTTALISAQLGTAARADSDHFWSHFYLNAVSENYTSVAEMAAASDVVVVGRLGPLEASRSWMVDPELGPHDGLAFYAKSLLKVERVIAGDYTPIEADTLVLELFVPVPSEFATIRNEVPLGRTMFFLDRKTDTDQPYYMVVSPNRGYLRDIGGVATPFGAEDQWLLDVAGRPFDVLSDQLAQVRARP